MCVLNSINAVPTLVVVQSFSFFFKRNDCIIDGKYISLQLDWRYQSVTCKNRLVGLARHAAHDWQPQIANHKVFPRASRHCKTRKHIRDSGFASNLASHIGSERKTMPIRVSEAETRHHISRFIMFVLCRFRKHPRRSIRYRQTANTFACDFHFFSSHMTRIVIHRSRFSRRLEEGDSLKNNTWARIWFTVSRPKYI